MKVVNINRGEHCDVYIGRKKVGMHFGNPFTHLPGTMANTRVNTRDEAVDAFRDWLLGTKYQNVEPQRRQWILDNMEQLRGKTLGCFCAPERCHGDVYVEMLTQPQPVVSVYKAYAGIGSRQTPPDICRLMTALGVKLESLGWTLRSGGAVGADSAFEARVTRKEIYVARGVNRAGIMPAPSPELWAQAEALVRPWAPHFDRQSPYVRDLFRRNMFQVFGANLDSPVKRVIFWAPEDAQGNVAGGTRLAVYAARHAGIHTTNLYFSDVRGQAEEFIA